MSAFAEQAIATRLAADSAVSGVISNRIYPHAAPQSAAMPYIVFQRIDAIHEHHMRGASGMYHSRIQLDLYATVFSTLSALRDYVRKCLDGFVGYITVGATVVMVRKCFLDGDQELYYPPEDDSQKGIYRASLDFLVTCDEQTPSFTG